MIPDNLELNRTFILERLKSLIDWRYNHEKLWKEFKFKDFNSILEFINRLSPYFEKGQHYPDIFIFNNRVLFEFQNLNENEDIISMNFEYAHEIQKSYNMILK